MSTAPHARPHGLWIPTLTPLDERLAPDVDRLAAHAERALAEGCEGVVLFGTTGEATSFSIEERRRVLDEVLERGLPRERLIVGTGCCALVETLALSRHALERDCRALLVLPPFYYKPVADDGLFASYHQLIEQLGRTPPLLLYHFPRLSGVPLTTTVIERLAREHPEALLGVKDSSGDMAHTAALIDRFPALAILPGNESRWLDLLRCGAAGCITASANLGAGTLAGLLRAWQAGDSGQAANLQEQATRTRAALDRRPMIPALKAVLAARTGHEAWRRVRPPLAPLPRADTARLLRELDG
jgi:4-hydroxy-tetrahydrodipicolinate synthase